MKVTTAALARRMPAYADAQARLLVERVAGEIRRSVKNPDADAVHDLRVAIRRLSQCLRIFAELYPAGAARRIRKRIRGVRRLAGDVRDRDIALEHLQEWDGDAARWAATLEKERGEHLRTLGSRLRRMGKREVWRKWAGRLSGGSGPQTGNADWDLGQAPASNAATRLPGLAGGFFASGRKLASHDATPAEIHQFRIEAKRFRYTLELFRPCYGPGLEQRLKALRQIQQVLGDMNDFATMLRLLGDDETGPPQLRPYLEGRMHDKISEFRQLWQGRFDAEGNERRWVRYLGRPSENRAMLRELASQL